jgi:glutaconate CoA-transferase subunit B
MAHSADEMMTVAAARELRDGEVCFVGIGLPSTAANLARGRHAPGVVLIYESGTIGSKPTRLPLSIGDGDLAETADAVVPVPEIFNYWLQGGRIDVGFLGAAQIDRHGNLNSTVIGPYDSPKVRLPGAGGAPEIAAQAGRVITIIRQSPRTFVAELDFKSSLGAEDQVVITDLGILRRRGKGSDPQDRKGSDPSDPASMFRRSRGSDPSGWGSDPSRWRVAELVMTDLHPGVTAEQAREATGWELQIADDAGSTEPPTDDELALLRELQAA